VGHGEQGAWDPLALCKMTKEIDMLDTMVHWPSWPRDSRYVGKHGSNLETVKLTCKNKVKCEGKNVK
jgi:hypothetical protein